MGRHNTREATDSRVEHSALQAGRGRCPGSAAARTNCANSRRAMSQQQSSPWVDGSVHGPMPRCHHGSVLVEVMGSGYPHLISSLQVTKRPPAASRPGSASRSLATSGARYCLWTHGRHEARQHRPASKFDPTALACLLRASAKTDARPSRAGRVRRRSVSR